MRQRKHFSCCSVRGGEYLWEVSLSHHNTIRSPLQNLPHAIIKAQRGPVQRTINLTPIQPRPEADGREAINPILVVGKIQQ